MCNQKKRKTIKDEKPTYQQREDQPNKRQLQRRIKLTRSSNHNKQNSLAHLKQSYLVYDMSQSNSWIVDPEELGRVKPFTKEADITCGGVEKFF